MGCLTIPIYAIIIMVISIIIKDPSIIIIAIFILLIVFVIILFTFKFIVPFIAFIDKKVDEELGIKSKTGKIICCAIIFFSIPLFIYLFVTAVAPFLYKDKFDEINCTSESCQKSKDDLKTYLVSNFKNKIKVIKASEYKEIIYNGNPKSSYNIDFETPDKTFIKDDKTWPRLLCTQELISLMDKYDITIIRGHIYEYDIMHDLKDEYDNNAYASCINPNYSYEQRKYDYIKKGTWGRSIQYPYEKRVQGWTWVLIEKKSHLDSIREGNEEYKSAEDIKNKDHKLEELSKNRIIILQPTLEPIVIDPNPFNLVPAR